MGGIEPPSGRFTPTRVGKTAKTCPTPRLKPVHPHARGENYLDGADVFGPARFTPTRVGKTLSGSWRSIRDEGSPPRAWGKRGRSRPSSPPLRFTPTRVGKTAVAHRRRRHRTVHPHARGENLWTMLVVRCDQGSPPRAWGKRGGGGAGRGGLRFTPTRVGKTLAICFIARSAYGSPPRAWGKRRIDSPCVSPLRFTPTRVGKTLARICHPD